MNFISSVFKSSRRSSASNSEPSPMTTPAPTAPSLHESTAVVDGPPSYEAAMASSSPAVSSSTAAATSSSSTASSTTRCLDLVFCVDCTGSMSSYINAAQQSMRDIVEKIVAAESVDIQCAIVAYRDWCDESTYVVKPYPFQSSLKKIQANINELSAAGGGDAPEAVTAGLAEVNNLNYRKGSIRFCILIADAPDHGLGESGDSLPNGDPKGRDPLQIARQLKEKNVAIYSVACEPALSRTQYGRDYFFTLARITGGRFLPLTSAALLADVVIGGAQEELSLQALEQSIAQEAQKVKAEAAKNKEDVSETVVAERVARSLAARGTKAHQVHFDGHYQNQNLRNVGLMENCESLAKVRSQLKPAAWGALVMEDGTVAEESSAVPRAAAVPLPKRSGVTRGLVKKSTEKAKSKHKKDTEEAKEEDEAEADESLTLGGGGAPLMAPCSSWSSSSSHARSAAAPSQKVHSDFAAISTEQVSRMLYRHK